MEPKLSEIVERVTGKIVTGMVIAGAIIGLAIYARPGPPRYQAIASGNAVIRLNTDSGAMIACNTERCVDLRRPGHRVSAHATVKALPKPAAPDAPAIPAQPSASTEPAAK